MKSLLAAITVVFVTACGDPVTSAINAKWPPLSEAQQRETAINTTAAALAGMTLPNLGVGIVLRDVEQVLIDTDIKKLGVTALKVEGKEQLVFATVSFERQFNGADVEAGSTAAGLLDKLKPKVKGSVQAYLGVAGALAADTTAPSLELRLLPGLSRVEIEKLDVAEQVDLTPLSDPLVAALNRYKDNITGELSRAPFSRTTIPTLSDKPIDVSQAVKLPPGATGTVQVTGNPIKVPLRLDGIAWLVRSNHLTALVQLSPLEASKENKTVEVKPTFTGLEDRFESVVEEVFGIEDGDDTNWLAIQKDVIALAMNSGIAQAGVCVTANVQMPSVSQSSKIKLPDGLGIDCSTTRDCNPTRQCSFEASHDTRDCSVCIAREEICVLGKCVGSGRCLATTNNPICEAAKAAQNAIYIADANLRKADCDRLRETDRLTCQAEVVGEKLFCEAKKEALNKLAKTGNFGNVDVTYAARTSDMKVCLRDFAMATDLERVSFALDVSGSAKADVDVKFVPLDIVGHITCQFPWSKSKTFDASLRENRVGLSSAIKLTTATDGARADFTVDEIDVKAKLSPGPTEFLLTSPELILKCPVLQGIAATSVALYPFIPQLRGEIDFKVKQQAVGVDIALPKETLGSKVLALEFMPTKRALIAKGKLEPRP